MRSVRDPSELEGKCLHKDIKEESGYFVCRDCGEVLDDHVAFEKVSTSEFYSDIQRDYERKIKRLDSKAKQDPNIKHKYDKIQTLEKWFRDYKTSFRHQKKTIDFLKGYDLKIDNTKFQNIKKRYLKYNKKHRKTYQNMVIIFLAIVWIEIKDTTNVRIERYIEICNELGHKMNKKMLNNAMQKIKRTETVHKQIKIKDPNDIEKNIKEKVKILFMKDLNSIPIEKVRVSIQNEADYEKLKVHMQLLADDFLNRISYNRIRNLNYKAFTAGLIYYIGQTLPVTYGRKIFTQSTIEKITKFSSTTIRKKYHILKDILGSPREQKVEG